jgi:CubicO group peptidase (beta-lactamase class C family)
MTRDTIFRYSSLTKPIVATATMALAERGAIDLDDPVTRWLPEFRPKLPSGDEPEIRVRHLLTHTAGLTYRMLQPAGGDYERAGVSDGLDESTLSIDEQLERLARVPLSYPPGTSWGYSGGVRRYRRTDRARRESDVAGRDCNHRDRATRHARHGVLCRRSRTAGRALCVRHITADHGRSERVPYLPGTAGIRFSPSRILNSNAFASGGVGMVGTAGDFLKLLLALRSGGSPLLSARSAADMRSNQIGELRLTAAQQPAWAFGFGVAVLMEPALAGTPHSAGTWQWGGAYGHHWYVDPANRVTVVAMTNTALEGMTGSFVGELMEAVYGGTSM